MANLFSALKGFFSSGTYNAAETSHKRKTPAGRPRSVDAMLPNYKRHRAVENARDLERNFAVASWAVRRHLDYVSTFNFEPKTGNPGLDQELVALMQWYEQPENCHVARRHSLSQIIRLAEAMRTVDGDLLLVKLRSGHLQAIEGDRIQDPPDRIPTTEDNPWINGVRTTKSGKAQSYGIHKRDKFGTYSWERAVLAENCWHHGYFQRFDQVRGVSPLTSALDTFRDAYEGFDYALSKLKLTQMFGLVITRDSGDEVGDHDGEGDVDFGDGPIKLELDANDDAKFIESQSPSLEFQQFTQAMLGVALKSLDIPYSFYDEAHTNFFGSRSAFTHYQKSARAKRAANIKLLDSITRWRLAGFISEGRLDANLEDLNWEWVPEGVTWWNPQQEVAADIAAIQAGLTSRTRVVKEKLGVEWTEIASELDAEEKVLVDQRGFLFDVSETELLDNDFGEVIDDE